MVQGKKRWGYLYLWLFCLPLLWMNPGEAEARAASIVGETIPTQMVAGLNYPVTVTVRNDGGQTWTESSGFRLGAVGDNDPFAGGRQYLPAGVTVGPGQMYTFAFTMTAPATPATLITDWRMVQEGVMWFGGTLAKTVEVTQPPLRDAKIVAHTIPEVMEKGKSYTVSIEVENRGQSTWTESNHFRLGAVEWPISFPTSGRQYLPGSQQVNSGQRYTFTFTLTAPGTAGEHTTRWRMLQEGVAWFGETLEVKVTVIDPARAALYTYTEEGRLKSAVYPSGHRMDYYYDPNGSITTQKLSANLLDIAGFEYGVPSWTPHPAMEVSAAAAKEGRQSLRFYSESILAGAVSSTEHMDVKANRTYTLSAWIQDNLTTGGFYVDWLEFNAAGQLIHDGLGFWGLQRGQQAWEYRAMTFTTSSQTAKMIVRVVADSMAQGEGFVDGIALVEGLRNPNFEEGTEGWSMSAGMSISEAKAKDGTKSIRFYADTDLGGTATSSDQLPTTPNSSYRLSFWIQDLLTSGNFYVDWLEFDARGQMVLDGAGAGASHRGSGQWEYKQVEFVTQPETMFLIVRIVADTSPVGEGFVDGMLLEKLSP